jgi:6-phosphogluconolactonase
VSHRDVLVFPDAVAVASAVATRLEEVIELDLATKGECHVVLTGGTVGIALLRHVAVSRNVDWNDVHIWWGDERFVPSDSADRNDGQAWDALLSRIEIPTENIHRIAAADSGETLDSAAASYAKELENFFGVDFPHFDVTLLGVGPDAHVASLFPRLPGVGDLGHTVIPVRDSPKPPPERVSLTLPSINSSRRVWVVAAGTDKSDAISAAVGPQSPVDAPVSAVRGIEETVFFIDEAARPKA